MNKRQIMKNLCNRRVINEIAGLKSSNTAVKMKSTTLSDSRGNSLTGNPWKQGSFNDH